jgi:uncharacterized protein (TIGR00252 family)
MARAAVAAGADGLMVEVHPDPENALSDGAQSLFPEQFEELMEQIAPPSPRAIGRRPRPAALGRRAREQGGGRRSPSVPRLSRASRRPPRRPGSPPSPPGAKGSHLGEVRAMSGKPLGDRGEALAARHLAQAGWRILDRNFRVGRKEIDLVARRGEVVAFVEVKTRAGLGFGHPLEAITWRKRREIQQVAAAWIDRHGRALRHLPLRRRRRPHRRRRRAADRARGGRLADVGGKRSGRVATAAGCRSAVPSLGTVRRDRGPARRRILRWVDPAHPSEVYSGRSLVPSSLFPLP